MRKWLSVVAIAVLPMTVFSQGAYADRNTRACSSPEWARAQLILFWSGRDRHSLDRGCWGSAAQVLAIRSQEIDLLFVFAAARQFR